MRMHASMYSTTLEKEHKANRRTHALAGCAFTIYLYTQSGASSSFNTKVSQRVKALTKQMTYLSVENGWVYVEFSFLKEIFYYTQSIHCLRKQHTFMPNT